MTRETKIGLLVGLIVVDVAALDVAIDIDELI